MSPAAPCAPLHVVVGARGQIGAHVVRELARGGARVRAVTRSQTKAACSVEAVSSERAWGDIGDAADAERLCSGAQVVYACFGGPHVTWSTQFPRMTRGLLTGAARAGARVVFADNLYAYGPQRDTLTEDTPAHPIGKKPRLRAEVAAMFLAAHRRGDTPVAVARASDLYGPGVENAMVSATLFAAALAGRRVYLPGDLDALHTFSFAPDVARAMVMLGACDDAFGEIWHVPSAPALSLSALVRQVGELGGVRSRVTEIPTVALRLASVFHRQVSELVELSFQWDRPYLVSHAKFAARFGLEPAPIERGLRLTYEWLAARHGAK